MYCADNKYIKEVQNRNFLKIENYLNDDLSSSHLLWGRKKNTVELTIFIPTYNRGSALKKAILSVLVQNKVMDFEILIVDNNPQNLRQSPIISMLNEIDNPNIVYYCNTKNLGPMGNWNRGYQLAAGKWVSMLHDDDYLHPEWLSEMCKALKSIGDGCDALACPWESINNERIKQCFREHKTENNKIKKKTVQDMFMNFCAPVLGSMIKKEIFLKLGGFYADTDTITPFEDYIFMTKVSFYGQLYMMNKKLYGYVINDLNDSNHPGIYNTIIIGEYFFRNTLIKSIDEEKSKVNKRYNEYKTIVNLSNHGFTKNGFGNFCTAPVNKELVISTCKISKIKYYLLHNVLIFIHYLRYYIKKIINVFR